MNSDNLHKLIQSGKLYKRPKGQIIHTFDDRKKLNFVKSGYIKRYLIAKDGTLGVQGIYGPGYVFPLTLVFKHLLDQKIYRGIETYYYQAMTDVQIYSIGVSMIEEAARKDPQIYKDLLIEAGRRLQSNIQQLENTSLKNASKEVAHQLVFLAREFGRVDKQNIKIELPLTQQDLADILNISRETASRAMSSLHKKGLIIPGRNIIVTDLVKLQEIYS